MPIYKVDGVKKDGLQKYMVRVNYISINGKYKQLSRVAYGSEAANNMEDKLRKEINSMQTPVEKMTLQQLYDEYETVKKLELRGATVNRNECNYRVHVKEKFADVYLHKITLPLLQEWKIEIGNKDLSISTKRHIYKCFNALLNYGVEMEHLSRNPLKKIKNFKDTIGVSKEMLYYTSNEFSEFINVARQTAASYQLENNNLSEWDYYVFFCIAFLTGLRRGEIQALKWSDIQGNQMSVKRSISQVLKDGDRETKPKNNSSIRTIKLPLQLVKVLNEHKERQKQLTHFTDDYRICGGENCIRNEKIHYRNIKYAKLANQKKIRIHDYRHSHASLLINEGVDIKEVARRLGHARVEETWNTYSHMYPCVEERATYVLNKVKIA